MLDELLAEAGAEERDEARPEVRLDYLSVADELHSGRIVISRDEAAAEYLDGAGEPGKPVVDAPPLAPEHPDTLPTDPQSIASELGLDKGRPPADLNMLRRRFAVANHPDRVAQHLRDDAMRRMQIANMLIDEAKKKQAAARGFFKR
ncbi:MAG: hypothetical protein JJ913_16560 [Rhizobiaceae bacterium]|nr:hypothetical protein [Rhizobiaceae bacterium]